jgi:nucleoside-diphosphate-sugar epimerase
MDAPKKVLVTGVYGLVGNIVYRRLRASPHLYDVYGLTRRRHHSDRLLSKDALAVPDDRLLVTDVAVFDAVLEAVQGMDVVVHMAADPRGEQDWDTLLPSNVIGAYNIFEASRRASVKRVLFASSVQALLGYMGSEPYKTMMEARFESLDPASVAPIRHDQPPRAGNIYGASKIWGEALAYVYAYTHGLSCLCLRIGWVPPEDRPPRPEARSMWCSHRDIAQFVERCLNAPDDLKFDIFFGISDNTYKMFDIEHTREVLGYKPQDNADNYTF